MQIGLGIVGVQRVIFVEARQDAWIAVLLSGLWIHLVVFIICQTLKQTEHDNIFRFIRSSTGACSAGSPMAQLLFIF